MTSKISYFNIMRQSARQRIWYGACMALVLFIALPVAAMLHFSGDAAELAKRGVSDAGYILDNMKTDFRAFVGGGYPLTSIAVGAGALLAAWSGLSYLHSSRNLDLMHSLPVKREKIFMAQTGASLLLFAVPYAANLLLVSILGALLGIYEPDMAGISLAAFFVHLIFFLAVYFFGSAAMLLTGKLLAGILGSLVLLGYLPGAALLLWQLPSIFYSTYSRASRSAEMAVSAAVYSSPVCSLGDFCVRAGKMGKPGAYWRFFSDKGWELLAFGAAAGLVMGALSWYLARIRPSKGAGHSLVFRRTEGAFKLALLPVLGIAGGQFFLSLGELNGGARDAWFWFGIVFSLIICSALIEIIYHFDRKRLLDHKLCTGIAILLTVGTGAWFQMDLGGFDNFLPAASRVKAMAVSYYNWYGSVMTEDGEMDVQTYLEKYGMMEAFDPIYRLAQEGVDAVRGGAPEDTQMTGITVIYQMENGQIKQREYEIPTAALRETEALLYEQEAYRNVMFPILTRDPDAVRVMNVHDPAVSVDLMQMSSEESAELVRTYQEELSTMSYEQLLEPASAILRFCDPDGSWIGNGLPVSRYFERTLAVLKERGCVPDASLNNIKISSITVNCRPADKDGTESEAESSDSAVYTLPDDIEAVRKNLVWDENNWLLGLSDTFEQDILVDVEGINAQGESVYISCRYPRGKIPEPVKEFCGLD